MRPVGALTAGVFWVVLIAEQFLTSGQHHRLTVKLPTTWWKHLTNAPAGEDSESLTVPCYCVGLSFSSFPVASKSAMARMSRACATSGRRGGGVGGEAEG